MCHPKREEIAGGKKITFEPTHIMEILVALFSYFLFYFHYNGISNFRGKLRKLSSEAIKS